ncbi:Vascular cell adhesion protein 1 [Oryzias melastigma]|uniref:Vascular cell adhesion protein 1 n=1 Tax=Oryzias melastigma TaxID=30732 RepID=A0A834FAT2_ORYME|nr:Vascular cell adhesion protein 1 [Oryzias melastigma]
MKLLAESHPPLNAYLGHTLKVDFQVEHPGIHLSFLMRLLAAAMQHLRMLGILILMIHFCDCEDSCSYNPVLLYPTEIIEEYGREVFINCSSDYLHFTIIKINVKNESRYPDLYRDYVDSLYTLDDWDIEATCIVHVNETHKCYKDVDITVYKNPEVDLLVKNEDAVAVELQCDVFNVAPVQNLSVHWYKNDRLIHTNYFSGTSRAPVNESSVLTVSREENVTQLRCEAQLNLRSRSLPATVSKTLNISATEIPISSNVTHSSNLSSETVTMAPPQSVVSNTTFHPLNMPGAENFTGINGSTTEDNESTTPENILYVAVTTKARPAENITCESLKKAFRITPPELVVRYGDPVVLTCSVNYTSVQQVSWETPFGVHKEMNNFTSTLTIDKVKTWKLELMCYAASIDDLQCTFEPTITVYKTPDSVSVTAVDAGPMIEGKEYQLSCIILNVAPVNKLHVKWYRGNESLRTEHPKNDSLSTPQNVTFVLTVPLERGDNGSTFRCEAELHLGPELTPLTPSAPYTVHVHYKPFFKSCPDKLIVEENKFRMSQLQCETDGNPPPSVEWSHLGQKLTESG